MVILKDSRQMPRKREYMANKMYSDVVYAWLQVNSQWDREANVRWIAKKDVKYVQIAQDLGITRQTASTKFKRLTNEVDKNGKQGLGLVTYNENLGRYELAILPNDMAMLIENGTLRKMVAALNENTINVYIYLLTRYLANNEQPYKFTIEQVKSMIGLGVGGRSNDYIVTDILVILKKIGLIDYELVTIQDDGEFRTVYEVTSIQNKIEC